MPDVNRQIVQPLGDRLVTAIAAQQRTGDGRQHGGQKGASSSGPPGRQSTRAHVDQ
ncbi:MAG: hypothetical protein AB7U20_08525 [Planctomycetaceae bacterium]